MKQPGDSNTRSHIQMILIVSQNLTILVRETIQRTYFYVMIITVINIKSDGDQPDAAQAKLHATDSPVYDVSSLSMSSTYSSSTSTIQQQQKTRTKTPRKLCFNVGSGNAWCVKGTTQVIATCSTKRHTGHSKFCKLI